MNESASLRGLSRWKMPDSFSFVLLMAEPPATSRPDPIGFSGIAF
jgi:hypothetical protein